MLSKNGFEILHFREMFLKNLKIKSDLWYTGCRHIEENPSAAQYSAIGLLKCWRQELAYFNEFGIRMVFNF